MILHILNKGPTTSDLCTKMSSSLAKKESILLIEDGIYHCLNQSPYSDKWFEIADAIYVLEGDAQTRGISIPDKFISVSYEDFVKLTIDHETAISWY